MYVTKIHAGDVWLAGCAAFIVGMQIGIMFHGL